MSPGAKPCGGVADAWLAGLCAGFAADALVSRRGLLARLRHAAVVHLRGDAGVVERAGQDRPHHPAGFGTAVVVVLEVVTLRGRDGADGEPDDEQERTDTHDDLRWGDCRRCAPRWRPPKRSDPVEDHVPEPATEVDGVELAGVALTEA